MQSRLLEGQEDLIEKKAKWLEEREVIKNFNQIKNNFVVINAGGTIVQTTIDNLTSVEDSRLERMFSGELTYIQQEDGIIYLDRNGRIFEAMIDYLRGDRTVVPKFTEFNDQL